MSDSLSLLDIPWFLIIYVGNETFFYCLHVIVQAPKVRKMFNSYLHILKKDVRLLLWDLLRDETALSLYSLYIHKCTYTLWICIHSFSYVFVHECVHTYVCK